MDPKISSENHHITLMEEEDEPREEPKDDGAGDLQHFGQFPTSPKHDADKFKSSFEKVEPDDGTNSQPTSAAVKAPTTLLSKSRKAPGLPSWNPEDPLAGLQKGVAARTELRGVHHRGPRGAAECGTEQSGSSRTVLGALSNFALAIGT
ncbi:hypothetical protein ACRRTK_018889 [Alexandromys fortis]